MQLNAILDVDLIALEAQDQVSVLLELTAPEAPADRRRQPGTLQLVLDRSGSMQDGRLEAAKQAITALLTRLDPTDNFGLVTFDSDVEVHIPAGPLSDKDSVQQLVRGLYTGSTTNLSGGVLRGIQEARRVKDGGATLVLLSDGRANEGVVEPDRLQAIAGAAQSQGVQISTIGIGLDYDELLMDAVARGGGGNSHFAEQGDAAGAAIATEVDHLLDQVVQATSLRVRPTWDVETVALFNDLPVAPINNGFMVELGDFYSGEQRKLLLTIEVPAMTGLGAVTVCELELSYVSISEMKSETITIPVNVNVVPGDAAAGRVPDATVRTEFEFQQAQRAKREAAERLRAGDLRGASQLYKDAGGRLGAASPAAPDEIRDEIVREARLLEDLAEHALWEDASRIAKFTDADRHMKSRKRGRETK
jgi:Ca-activated chloride channel family protein